MSVTLNASNVLSNAFKRSLEKLSRRGLDIAVDDTALTVSNVYPHTHSDGAGTALNAFPDAVSLHDKSGKLVWASKRAETLYNTTPSKMIDMGFLTRINPQDTVAVLQMISDCHLGKTVPELHIRYAHSDGHNKVETRIVECRASQYEGGCVLLISRDVTEQMHKIEQTDSRVDVAESANRLKSSFISNVSHELRTPLNAIIGFSEMLEGNTGLEFSEKSKKEYAGLINQSAKHLLHLLNDILDVSKIEAGKFAILPEFFDIETLVSSTAKILDPIAVKSKVSITTKIDEHLPEIFADKRGTRQIILNLVANAIKFSNEGGNVCIGVSRTARNVVIEVRDSGIGMDAETVAKLGSAFFQAEQSLDRRFEGTGLGLSIVMGLVSLHGGMVRFASKPGIGTTVRVQLPLTALAGNPVPTDPDSAIVYLDGKAQGKQAEQSKKLSMQRVG